MNESSKTQRKKLVYIFLEGKTEDVFYKRITNKYLKPFPKKYKNLQTGTNINMQIVRNLYHFLSDNSNLEYDLYVYAFIDKEGARSDISVFDSSSILMKLGENIKTDTIKELDSIEAIFMIESWFFHDLEGICRYINLSYTDTLKKNYSNPERLTDIHLSELFKKGNTKKRYKKGEDGFLNSLDIEKIYNNCSDLRSGIECIINKFNYK